MQNGKIPHRADKKTAVKLLRARIPAFRGRPKRKNVICSDDVINLKIALNASMSLEEFLDSV